MPCVDGDPGQVFCIMDLRKEHARGSKRYPKRLQNEAWGVSGTSLGGLSDTADEGSKKETPKSGLGEFVWGVFLVSFSLLDASRPQKASI